MINRKPEVMRAITMEGSPVAAWTATAVACWNPRYDVNLSWNEEILSWNEVIRSITVDGSP